MYHAPMKVQPYQSAKIPWSGLVFRQSRLRIAIGFAVCLLFPAVGIFMICIHAGLFGWYFAIVGALITLFPLRRAVWASSHHNWLLRFNYDHLFLKIAPDWSRNTSNAFVADIKADEILWIRLCRETITRQFHNETQTQSTAFLEIQLRDPPPDSFRDALAAACTTRRGIVTSTYKLPVSLTPKNLLRVQWLAPWSFITPTLPQAIHILGQTFPVEPEAFHSLQQAAPPVALPKP